MRLKAIAGVLLLTVLSIATANAQGLPCGGTDPDATCPIDSWVLLLAAASAMFAVYTLLKRKKAVTASVR